MLTFAGTIVTNAEAMVGYCGGEMLCQVDDHNGRTVVPGSLLK
jgi:hypothetical protein